MNELFIIFIITLLMKSQIMKKYHSNDSELKINEPNCLLDLSNINNIVIGKTGTLTTERLELRSFFIKQKTYDFYSSNQTIQLSKQNLDISNNSFESDNILSQSNLISIESDNFFIDSNDQPTIERNLCEFNDLIEIKKQVIFFFVN